MTPHPASHFQVGALTQTGALEVSFLVLLSFFSFQAICEGQEELELRARLPSSTDGSVVKSTCSSSRRLEFGPQHPLQVVHLPVNSSSKGSNIFWSPQAPTCIQHRHTHIHMTILKYLFIYLCACVSHVCLMPMKVRRHWIPLTRNLLMTAKNHHMGAGI